ncbi:hypothetical protein D3C81_1875490 [compost metagenome]
MGVDDVERREGMVSALQHPDSQPNNFTLLSAVLSGVADDTVRVGRRVKKPDRGVDMIEVADDLLLFGADEFQERGEFAALLDKTGDSVGAVVGYVFHERERNKNSSLRLRALGVFAP